MGSHEGSRVTLAPRRGVVAVIPARNEEEAVATAVEAVAPGLAERVVVVDNASTDRTAEVARKAGAHVVMEPTPGYGRACLAALAHVDADAPHPRVILFLDADHRHDMEELQAVVTPVVDGEVDLVLGVRTGSASGAAAGRRPPLARWGTSVILAVVRALHGVRFRDLPPVRAIGFQALKGLRMDDPHFGWTLQMQIRAHRAGLAVREVDLEHRERSQGRSKISGSLTASVRAGLRMIRVALGERRWSPPGNPAPPPETPSGALPPGDDRTRA